MYGQHLHTQLYIVSVIDEVESGSILVQPHISRWPKEWTAKVEALKERKRDGWEQHVRMMNCMKIFGLSITKQNSLYARDRRSKGYPHMFWGHTLRGKSVIEDVQWEVATAGEVDVPGRIYKTPSNIGDIDCYGEPSLPHGLVLHPEDGRETCYENECRKFVANGVFRRCGRR
jgi:hypothetical protein